MDCLICKELERVFESRLSDYIEARSAAYYRVTTEFAAYKNVDKERARSDLEEHRLVCVSAKVRQSTLPSGLDGDRYAGQTERTARRSGRLPLSPCRGDNP